MKKILTAINPVLKVVLVYLALATVWILFSDRLVYLIAAGKGLITTYQTFKGLFFVSATSVLLYVLISKINNRLQKIMDQSPAVICTVDQNGKFSQINSAAREIWGYEQEYLVNKEFLNFIHPADVASTAKRADEILKGADVRGFENRYVRPDGSSVWMKWSARWDTEDKLMYCIGIDATALKQAKEKVVKERNILRAIIDNIPDYIFAKDAERRMILSNKAMNRAIYGGSEEKGLGKTSYEILDAETAKPIDDDDRRVIEKGELIINREETAYNAKGDKLWLQTTKVPLRSENNDIYGLVGITRNITKKKRVEDQIKLANERYEMVMKATRDTVYDWNLTTGKLSWGDNFGSNRTENYSIKYWLERIHPEDQKQVEQSLEQALESSSENQWESEYRYVNVDRTYDTILEKGFIIRDNEGTAVRMIGALQDITELKQKEHEIRESLKEKEVLISEIHHRVKNNLALISGIVQLQVFEEKNEALANKLMNLVTRIHSIANVQDHLYQSSSFSNLDFSSNLETLIKHIINTVHTDTAVELGFKLDPVQINVNQAMPASIIVNEVILNILKHSFKEMDKGKIISELDVVNDKIALKISNNGQGLPEGLGTKESKTVGLKLIEVLAKQLDADYGYKSTLNESVFKLEFKKADLKGIGNAYL